MTVARPSVASPGEWDRFAQACGASFRCSYWAARAWQFESHWAYRLLRLDVVQVTHNSETKIGQSAIGVGRAVRVFSDSLQLLPGHGEAWTSSMTAVLRRAGPGTYLYGSEWSLDPPREDALGAIPGIRIENVDQTTVHVIDFTRWPDFDAYVRATSSNVRRNVKKAEKSYGVLKPVVTAGRSRFGYFLKSVSLRRALFLRKGVRRSTLGMVVRSVARLASLQRYTRTAYLIADQRLTASYVEVNFGLHYCYLEGASDHEAKGCAWFLLMNRIASAFADSGGRGRFVMGSDDGSQAGVETWEGLRRSRKQCCAEPMPTSIVSFHYRATSGVVATVNTPSNSAENNARRAVAESL